LVKGNDRALLIDGLLGVGYIRQFIRELTDLPVNLVLTHGHIDHSGAAWEYQECYIHPDDIALLYARGDEGKRLEKGQQKIASVTAHDIPKVVPVKTYPVFEGDIFDLGGRHIEVVEVPGHSKGSIGLLDRDDKILYSGDLCLGGECVRLSFANSSTSVEEYKNALIHLTEYMPYFDIMWSGHDHEAVEKSVITETIQVCQDILNDKDEKAVGMLMGNPVVYAWKDSDRLPNIAYLPDSIFQDKQTNIIIDKPAVFQS